MWKFLVKRRIPFSACPVWDEQTLSNFLLISPQTFLISGGGMKRTRENGPSNDAGMTRGKLENRRGGSAPTDGNDRQPIFGELTECAPQPIEHAIDAGVPIALGTGSVIRQVDC